MERDNVLPESVAGVPAAGMDGINDTDAVEARKPEDARAVEADAEASEPQVRLRTPGSAARRRTPSSVASRRLDRDTAAKVEEWRVRQASRAVPSEYRAGAGGQMPPQVFVPDDDVLAAQNEIPAQGRPVRTRPSIPNYTPRQETWRVTALDADEDAVDAAPVDADVIPEESSAVQNAADALRGSAAKAGEAGAALLENLQQSEAAGKAKDLAASLPGRASDFGSRAAAALRAEDGTLRKKPLIIAAAIAVYLVVAVFFSFHYYPVTTIGQVQVGGMDVPQATGALAEAVDGYALQVEGENGESFTVMGSEAGLSLDAEDLARQAMDADPGLLWPLYLFLPHDHTDVMVASADANGFREKISDAVNWYNKDAIAPRDATIAYDADAKAFSITPEERGTTLDEEKIVAHVTEALASMEPVLKLGEDDYVLPSVFQDDERLQTALEEAQKVLQTDITFTAHGSDVGTLDGTTAATWVLTDENVQLALDEDKVNDWVQKLVDKCGTVGSKRTWTREDGVECTVEGGTYGWEADWLAVDEALHDAVGSGSATTVEVPMQQEAAVYDGAGKRDWKSYIDVDLDAQHAVYYDDKGKVLWEADFVSGSPDGEHDTPQGVYSINNKESPSTLVGEANATGSPEYQTEVQYWMAWRGNDVGFHDAEWQDEFGGNRYQEGFGSHGCINLSTEDAARLFKLADIDTVVVCHSGSGKASKKEKKSDDEKASDTAEAAEAPAAEEVAEEAVEEPAYEEYSDAEYSDEGYEDEAVDDGAYDEE